MPFQDSDFLGAGRQIEDPAEVHEPKIRMRKSVVSIDMSAAEYRCWRSRYFRRYGTNPSAGLHLMATESVPAVTDMRERRRTRCHAA